MGSVKIVVIMACHNRVYKTLECLKSTLIQANDRFTIKVVLVDDGSVDGTSELVQKAHPEVYIVRGSGDWYWAKSMAVAEAEAVRTYPDFDYLLWLNDDVRLHPSAISRLLQFCTTENIVVGATLSSDSLETTYSGLKSLGTHPLKLELVIPNGLGQKVDTFNGNVVLVGRNVVGELGGIDGEYSHALADIDYGYRATKRGINVLLVGSHVGECERNPENSKMGLVEAISKSFSVKSTTVASYSRFYFRHRPISAPYLILRTFFSTLYRNMR